MVKVHGRGIRDLYFSEKASKFRERVTNIYLNAFFGKKNEIEFDDNTFLTLIKIRNIGCCFCVQPKKMTQNHSFNTTLLVGL